MHIPDGFLDTKTIITTAVISAGALGYGIKKVNQKLGERQVPLLGLTAAFIFAAQMLNFPVVGGTSGHFLGGVLAAVLLGPWAACLIMAVVLIVQSIGFADGGLTALGANIFNMGVVGGILSYYVFVAVKKCVPRTRLGFLSSVAIASWLSIVLASASGAFQLAVSGTSPLHVALPAMVGVHMLIGIGEAIIATAVVSIVLGTRPDLVSTYYVPVSATKER
ncbi:cobalt/nickel transport system permease protein [Candidatus Hakubella thermalkaliphila]|uniref:Cobalt/nickel transport system permease protein n=1 Tax=Candidatus Hakubella thermalkaliphila TaxID=2754717 RepID=A0A6V8NL23_9ACTN|nr:energy-coupling factor ABC transporter permease [Candidatus Hakubella thermalkaliphila]GFP20968.1 cobalt/nickel transport system permease protein [Candidatus Hakubella thermalkaliphila]